MFAPYLLDGWIVASLVAVASGCARVFRGGAARKFCRPCVALGGVSLVPRRRLCLGLGRFTVWPWRLCSASGCCYGSSAGSVAMPPRPWRWSHCSALGALFLSLSGRYAEAVYALLFGQIFAVGPADVVPALALSVLVPAGAAGRVPAATPERAFA